MNVNREIKIRLRHGREDAEIVRRANAVISRLRSLARDAERAADDLQRYLDAGAPVTETYLGVNSLGVFQGNGPEVDRMIGELCLLVSERTWRRSDEAYEAKEESGCHCEVCGGRADDPAGIHGHQGRIG